ncbi:MAG: hypothetical protein J0M24_06165 [Verrucomicrobia bacterium]|nr:hypothetical protein [Verrucomicrobiota bacterium]
MTKASLVGLAATALSLTQAGAFDLNVTSLNTNNNPDANTSWFDVSLSLNGNGTATYTLANLTATGNGTKVSTIYLGTNGGTPDDLTDGFYSLFKKGTVAISYSGVTVADYSVSWEPTGGGQILNNGGWAIQVEGKNKNGNNNSVINAGESISLTFELKSPTTTEAELIAGFYSDPRKLGVAFHVQAITGGYSEWYEAMPDQPQPAPAPVPLPDGGATLAYLGLGFLGIYSLRRAIRA